MAAERPSPREVERARVAMAQWTTLDLLCAGHRHRRDFTAAQRVAAVLVLRERGYGPLRAGILRALVLPSLHDAYDGGASLPDVLRGWGGVAAVATVGGMSFALLLGRRAKPFVLACGLLSLLLLGLGELWRRRAKRRRSRAEGGATPGPTPPPPAPRR